MDDCDPSPAGTEQSWRSHRGFLVFPRCYSQLQLSTGWSKDGHKHPHCGPSAELGPGLLPRGCEHRGAGTLLGSVGSSAQEVSGCPVTKTLQNPQGAEPGRADLL